MPEAMRTHRPRPTVASPHGTLKERQGHRTLALNGATWRKLRALVLTEQPMCPSCTAAGYIGQAVEVDHIDNDPSNNLRDNLVGLCKTHHGQKTRRAQLEKITGNRRTTNRP